MSDSLTKYRTLHQRHVNQALLLVNSVADVGTPARKAITAVMDTWLSMATPQPENLELATKHILNASRAPVQDPALLNFRYTLAAYRLLDPSTGKGNQSELTTHDMQTLIQRGLESLPMLWSLVVEEKCQGMFPSARQGKVDMTVMEAIAQAVGAGSFPTRDQELLPTPVSYCLQCLVDNGYVLREYQVHDESVSLVLFFDKVRVTATVYPAAYRC